MADAGQTVTPKPVRTPHRLEIPYQIATQFSVFSDADGFYLLFETADPSTLNPETLELPLHPISKIYVGRNMMQNVIRTLLSNSAVQDLPDMRAAREQAEKDINDMLAAQASGSQEKGSPNG